MKLKIPDIPENFWDPLHILNPFTKILLFSIFLAFLAILLWFILYLIYKKRDKKMIIFPSARNINYQHFIKELEQLILNRQYKTFLFYVSYYFRLILQKKLNYPFIKKTPEEIADVINDQEILSFLKEIEYYKYSEENIDEIEAKKILHLFQNYIKRRISLKKHKRKLYVK